MNKAEVRFDKGCPNLYIDDEKQLPMLFCLSDFPGAAADEILLGDDEFFVLGDNLSQSKDSRYETVGIVDGENIIGKVIPYKNFKASR